MRLGPRPGIVACLQRPLARDKVRYVGEPVAFVVAESRYVAEDALELIEVDYDPLPAVADARRALEGGAPVLHEVDPRQPRGRERHPQGRRASRARPRRPPRERAASRCSATPACRWRRAGSPPPTTRARGVLSLWGVAKVPHFNRRVLADLLGHPEHLIHFVELEVGGGFGVRGEFYPEDLLVPWAAMRLGRPVQWIEDRREHLMATNHSRQQYHDVEIGFDADGRIVALADRFVADMGAYIRTHGVVVPELTAALLPGPYRIPNYTCEVRCVLTNKTPTGTYRGPGRFEGTFVRERLMDIAASRLGVDPLELRRRNFVTPDEMPYEVGGESLNQHITYDCGDYALGARRGAARARLRRRARRAGGGAARGPPSSASASACLVEKAGLGPWEYARVEVDATGHVVRLLRHRRRWGRASRPRWPRCAADELGVSPESRHRRPRRQRAGAVRRRRLREPRRLGGAARRARGGAQGAGEDPPPRRRPAGGGRRGPGGRGRGGARARRCRTSALASASWRAPPCPARPTWSPGSTPRTSSRRRT